MNAQQLISETARQAKILNMRSVRAAMFKHPDAEWSIGRDDSIHGAVYLGYVDPKAGEDIRDIANSADSDGWVLNCTPISKCLRGGIKMDISIVAYQSYDKDEVETLRGIGILRDEVQKEYKYTTLACHTH